MESSSSNNASAQSGTETSPQEYVLEAARLGLDPRIEAELSGRFSSVNRMWAQCPDCRFLSPKFVRENGSYRCKYCRGKRQQIHLYPSFSALELLISTIHFFKGSYEFLKKERSQMLIQIELETGKLFEFKVIFDLANNIGDDYGLLGGTEANFETAMQMIEKELGLSDREVARKIFLIMMNNFNEPHENKAVLVMTCSLLEILSYQLIRDLYCKNGIPPNLIDEFVARLRTSESIKREFKILTGLKLSDAISGIGFSKFYDGWEKTRNSRNDLVHKGKLRNSNDVAETAIDLAIASFEVFAKLHNKFVVPNNSRNRIVRFQTGL